MSRSYKKFVIYKAKGGYGRYHQRLAHKRNRMLARSGIYLKGLAYKMVVDQYDVCDYVYIPDKDSEWYKRVRRK